jgi:glucose-6-phosphate 1-dehydrogenase
MKKLDNTVLVIFGITGDLAGRKLLPALYNLAEAELLPEHFRIAGISRRGTTTGDIIELIKKNIEKNSSTGQEERLKIYKILAVIL